MSSKSKVRQSESQPYPPHIMKLLKLPRCITREIRPMTHNMQLRFMLVQRFILGNPRHFAKFEALAAKLGNYEPNRTAGLYAAQAQLQRAP